jgi:hypothetical protein
LLAVFYSKKGETKIKTAKTILNALRHRVGWLGICALMMPALWWVWLAAREPVHGVFSGGVLAFIMGPLFSAPFDIVHAGSALDQPTIGKWLFWFTVMAGTSLPFSLLVRWLSDRTKVGAYVAYAAFATMIETFLLCIVSGPFLMLIQYVYSMGITSRRIHGLLFAVAGGMVVLGFVALAFRAPREMPDVVRRHRAVRWCVPVTVVAVAGGLIGVVNLPTWTAQGYCLWMVDHAQMAQESLELLRATTFPDGVRTVTYAPGTNWDVLPEGLRALHLKLINVERQSVVLRKSGAAIFVLRPRTPGSAEWDLVLRGHAPLYTINKRILTVVETGK